MSAAARSAAVTQPVRSTVRSKRIEASLTRPSERLVRLIDAGLKLADSSSTLTVASETSVASPPMTPASATGPVGSQMSEHGGVERALDTVEREQSLALVRAAHDDRCASVLGGQRVQIERVKRLAEFEHARSS